MRSIRTGSETATPEPSCRQTPGDNGLGVQEYALKKLGIEIVELKWGQGAKDIGGEVKITDLAKAQMLKSRGYVVFPDPSDPEVIEASKRGVFSEFERHSRVGMVTEDGFMDRVQELRTAGAKHVFLKTGAYRPADLARMNQVRINSTSETTEFRTQFPATPPSIHNRLANIYRNHLESTQIA